ncbi:uncharacterized protein LOC114434260 [Parambassis ranga]|uniref:Uncharacterized protein LOC114434260 n=1 Tax=Parambassis ranga TaxID=210632 RepID=A0A6P7I8A6_9TELE|nr:uncharacterized protein LOC114434260 [Parambassis ranga]
MCRENPHTLAAGIRSDSNKCNQCLMSHVSMYRCLSSSDTQARNTSIVYDEANDNKHLWKKPNLQDPLPPCSSTSPPPANRCIVCMNQIVHAVCNEVVQNLKLIMETGENNVPFSDSACPALHSPNTTTNVSPGPGLSPSVIPTVIVIVLVGVLVMILIVWFLRRTRGRKEGSRQSSRSDQGVKTPREDLTLDDPPVKQSMLEIP